MLRFFFKLGDPSVPVGNHDAETAGFLDGYGHTGDGHVGFVGLVVIQHYFIIHLVDMIAGQDQHIIRVVHLHVRQVLENGVGRTGIPVGVLLGLIGRENGNAAHISVQIPWNTNSDMGIQTKGLILCQNAYRINSRVDTVAERKVDDAIFSAECHRRFGHLLRENTETASLSSGQ